MKKIIYIYILDTMADWEIGYILQATSMQTMLKEPKYLVKTVGHTKTPIKTLGGLTIIPDCTLEEINNDEIAAIILPGANAWNDDSQKSVLDLVLSLVNKDILIGAICGATLALADLGLLNNRLHTSNSMEYLCGCSKNYKGESFYKNELSVTGGNIITASSAGGLLWAKQIIEYLNIYSDETIDAWYKCYLTGDSKYYTELISSLKYF